MISIWVQAKPIIIIVIHIYAQNLDAQETEVELQMTSRYNSKKKKSRLITGDWNGKVGNMVKFGIMGKFNFSIRNETGNILIEFCQMVMDYTFWSSKVDRDGNCSHEINISLLFGRKAISDPK